MRFINPKTDLAFKKIFGSAGSKPILISFLNAMLYSGESEIVDLEIIDPYSIPRLEGMKDSYLDVRAQLKSGETVLIEMQVLNVAGLEKRILFNAAKEYSNQLDRGMDYSTLNPVIALTITDFVLFAEEELEHRIITRFVLQEKESLIQYPDGDVELVFVELPKFRFEESELKTLTEKWLYFLRTAPDLNAVPEVLGKVPEIQKAFEIAEFAKLTRDEERALEKKAQWIVDQRALQILNEKFKAQNEKFKAQNENYKAQNENYKVELEKERKKAKEEARKAKEEAKKAKEEAKKAQKESKRAEEEADRAKRLAEKLRQLGINPEEI
jgi:predicted transposase/invertase (TIGR01784 family)